MELFGALSFIISISTSFLVYHVYKNEKYVLTKPSFWFVAVFHGTIQWASAIYYQDIYLSLDSPYNFFAITHIVPFSIIIISRNTFSASAKEVWRRITETSNQSKSHITEWVRLYKLTSLLSVLVVGIYLIFVPLTQTGLYVGITSNDLLLTSLARENSLKLLSQEWLKYAFAYFTSFLAPLTAGLAIIISQASNKEGLKRHLFKYWIAIAIIVIATMLPGDRATGAYVLFVAVISGAFYNIKNFRLGRIVLLLFAVLIPAIIMEMFRKYDISEFNLSTFSIAFEELFFRRALFVPMDVGIKWVKYVEYNGYFGIAGIPKLASIFGIESVHAPNLMMNYYFPSSSATLRTGYMNASFIFTYYCYFGIGIVPFLIAMVLFLDTWVIMYLKIKKSLAIPTVVTLTSRALTW